MVCKSSPYIFRSIHYDLTDLTVVKTVSPGTVYAFDSRSPLLFLTTTFSIQLMIIQVISCNPHIISIRSDFIANIKIHLPISNCPPE